MPVGAAVGAAVAGAAVSAGIGALTKSSSGGAIQGGADAANAISKETVNEARNLYTPYITPGQNGLTAFADLSGVNGPDAASKAMSGFTASPGYQYQVEQGLRAVDAGAAAKGILRSGATLKAEQTLGSNLANQGYKDYLGQLNTLAGFGLDATKGFTNVLTGQSNQQQDTTTKAAGAIAGQTDAFGNTLSNAAGGLIKNSIYDLTKTGNGGGTGSNVGYGYNGSTEAADTYQNDPRFKGVG